ncbi:MAG TPA: FAD-dependent oxidoreductase [Bacteroidales bacterium]|nr:FAD-dependent oxidoreductase [Bacteroidales bacterium]
MALKQKIVVIGGGIAGIEASSILSRMDYDVTLIEKTDNIGGHVAQWDRLFPNQRKSDEIIEYLKANIPSNLKIKLNTTVSTIAKSNTSFVVSLSDNELIETDSILISTGYDLFDAKLKEEYGYGIYDNVITSAELEKLFRENKPILTKSGKEPQRIGFVHCVGSRDRKINNIYCSKVCCVTAVKQAIEVRQKLPYSEAYCFYMDLRMYGLSFEEIYNESQEKYGVTFIRGRLSEAAENKEGQIIVKVEDTLLGRPMKMTMDLLVLMVGMTPSEGTSGLIKMLNLETNSSHFIASKDEHTQSNITSHPGIFVAGAATSPKSIDDTLADARGAVVKILEYLNSNAQ